MFITPRIQTLKAALGPVWLTLVFFVVSAIALSLFRVGLMIWQADRVADWSAASHILSLGVRVDISSLCYLLAIPLLLSLVSYLSNRGSQLLRPLLIVWYCCCFTALCYLEAVTPTFINEYDLRPNRLLIEYLIYPKEVMSMLISGYKLEIAFTGLILFVSARLAWRLFNQQWLEKSNVSWSKRTAIALVLVFCTALGARSSLGHRPLNPAMVSFSTDHLLNGLVLNSSYSLAFAIKQMSLENPAAKFYGKLSEQEVINEVKAATTIPSQQFIADTNPTLSEFNPSYQGKPKNLVILLQESLGARFVGGLGGLPLTPNLDELMTEGWNFTNLYATGTRSVRGIEAIVTGFTPTPSRSVVKLDKSQRNFFTLASFLAKQDYHTQFIYGGESHFDNMKSFFLGNGFNDIVDLDDFAKVDFEGSWGASDEDLFDQAHLEFEQLSKTSDKPFFSLVFTSSNHSPFEFPDGKIALYDDNKHTRNNAAKYADYALGQFINKARKSSYWQDTVFIVIADHDSRVAGASEFPIDRFRIPGVIFGQGIQPTTDNRLVSQIDIAPTLLSLIGAKGKTPMLGHDLTKHVPEEKQRAMMQYDKAFAYMTNESVTLLQPYQQAENFNYVAQTLSPKEADIPLAKCALAHVLFGSMAYQNNWYQ